MTADAAWVTVQPALVTGGGTVTVTMRAATPFTDPVLTVGVTPVKAVHMTELRAAPRTTARVGHMQVEPRDTETA